MKLKSVIVLLLLLALTAAKAQQSQLRNGEFYANLNDVKHWYRISGAEHHTVPIVVIHGGPGGNHYVFERTAGKELEKFSTVIYYEQRGCGRSSQPANDSLYSVPLLVNDLEALRQHLGLKKFIPLGYSFGASLAMEYTLAHPSNVQRLILESFATLQDSAVTLGQMANFYSIAGKDFRHRIDSILSLNTSINNKYNLIWNNANKKDVIRFLFYHPENGDKVFSMWNESKLVNTGKMKNALMQQHRSTYLAEDGPRIPVPVLIMAGLYDKNGALTSSMRLKEEIKQAKFVLFTESAHFPDVEETKKFADEIKAWLPKK